MSEGHCWRGKWSCLTVISFLGTSVLRSRHQNIGKSPFRASFFPWCNVWCTYNVRKRNVRKKWFYSGSECIQICLRDIFRPVISCLYLLYKGLLHPGRLLPDFRGWISCGRTCPVVLCPDLFLDVNSKTVKIYIQQVWAVYGSSYKCLFVSFWMFSSFYNTFIHLRKSSEQKMCVTKFKYFRCTSLIIFRRFSNNNKEGEMGEERLH